MKFYATMCTQRVGFSLIYNLNNNSVCNYVWTVIKGHIVSQLLEHGPRAHRGIYISEVNKPCIMYDMKQVL